MRKRNNILWRCVRFGLDRGSTTLCSTPRNARNALPSRSCVRLSYRENDLLARPVEADNTSGPRSEIFDEPTPTAVAVRNSPLQLQRVKELPSVSSTPSLQPSPCRSWQLEGTLQAVQSAEETFFTKMVNSRVMSVEARFDSGQTLLDR